MTEPSAPFAPDWISPPGDTVLDLLEERGWTQTELASRLGYSAKHVNQMLKGKAPLTESTALRLERVLGGSAGFWLAREARYRGHCARLAAANAHAGSSLFPANPSGSGHQAGSGSMASELSHRHREVSGGAG